VFYKLLSRLLEPFSKNNFSVLQAIINLQPGVYTACRSNGVSCIRFKRNRIFLFKAHWLPIGSKSSIFPRSENLVLLQERRF